MSLPIQADAVIIGAGFAGLSAATRLAAAGRKVVVVDEAPRLGGRASSFIDRDTGERVDNGQHVLFGCYRETYAFLRRIGADGRAPLQRQLTLTMADGEGGQSTLACPNLPAPWHLVAGLMRWRSIGVGDRLRALRLAGFLGDVRRVGAESAAARVNETLTVDGWLDEMGQPPALRAWLWHPLTIAALNQSAAVASAAPFVRVLGELFGADPKAAAIGLPSVPLDDLYAIPASAFIEERGGAMLLKTPGRIVLDARGAIAGVRVGASIIETRQVVSTVPWHAFHRIWERDVPVALGDVAARAAAMSSSPIVTVNAWFDDVPDLPAFVGFVNGPMHWMFNKGAIYRNETRHLSLVASGADDLSDLENRAIVDLAIAQLVRAIPSLRSARAARAVVVRERRATFSLAPGGPTRPGTVTPIRGLVLGGDWTDTGLPATIEGAVRSGHAAAEALLAEIA
jgi:squalene-associated FAD-dependent desaturase